MSWRLRLMSSILIDIINVGSRYGGADRCNGGDWNARDRAPDALRLCQPRPDPRRARPGRSAPEFVPGRGDPRADAAQGAGPQTRARRTRIARLGFAGARFGDHAD